MVVAWARDNNYQHVESYTLAAMLLMLGIIIVVVDVVVIHKHQRTYKKCHISIVTSDYQQFYSVRALFLISFSMTTSTIWFSFVVIVVAGSRQFGVSFSLCITHLCTRFMKIELKCAQLREEVCSTRFDANILATTKRVEHY